MKKLLYKEFKLAWHPLCYVFTIVFNTFILIPNYPAFVGIMLSACTYTLLFIGANKGKQTNDLYYSVTLPVKKSNIVIARFISLLTIQLVSLIITACLAPASYAIRKAMYGTNIPNMGFDLNYIGLIIAFAIIAYSALDAIFLLMFYRKGRSVITPSLVGMFALTIIMIMFTIVLPIAIPTYKAFFQYNWWIQLVCIAIAIVIYVLSHIFIIKQAIKELKKINF